MNITQLVNRFQYYATQNLAINYDPDSDRKSFLVCDMEEINAAVRNGISLPCLFLQVPEFDKDGLVDNPIESVQGSFIILQQVNVGDIMGRMLVYDQCKSISDQVINQMIADTDEYFEGGMLKTAEGRVGPLGDQLYGWGVNFAFDQGYNGEVDPTKWKGTD